MIIQNSSIIFWYIEQYCQYSCFTKIRNNHLFFLGCQMGQDLTYIIVFTYLLETTAASINGLEYFLIKKNMKNHN